MEGESMADLDGLIAQQQSELARLRALNAELADELKAALEYITDGQDANGRDETILDILETLSHAEGAKDGK